jgi:hypothetical protein
MQGTLHRAPHLVLTLPYEGGINYYCCVNDGETEIWCSYEFIQDPLIS